jgi:hypothetical protein
MVRNERADNPVEDMGNAVRKDATHKTLLIPGKSSLVLQNSRFAGCRFDYGISITLPRRTLDKAG